MVEKDIAEKVVRGSFTISLNISGRTIQMGGYVQEGESKEDLNKRIDEYQEIIDRQLIRADTKDQEGRLRMELIAFEQAIEEFEKLVKKQESAKLHSQELAKLRNRDQTLNAMKTSIEMRRKHIEENRKTLAQL